MKPAIRDALDRLMLEVQSDQGQHDLVVLESYVLCEEERWRLMRADLKTWRDEMEALLLGHSSEFIDA